MNLLRWITRRPHDDGRRPHKFPASAIGEEVLAWECQACGEVVREFGRHELAECPINWRNA